MLFLKINVAAIFSYDTWAVGRGSVPLKFAEGKCLLSPSQSSAVQSQIMASVHLVLSLNMCYYTIDDENHGFQCVMQLARTVLS